jgi:hypothetical protein
MKKKIVLLFFLGIGLISFSIKQYSFGPGVVFFSIDTTQVIRFYENSNDERPFRVLRFCNHQFMVGDETSGYMLDEIIFCTDDTTANWLQPEEFYLYMTMRCLEETKLAYLVCVNNQTAKSLWIKKTESRVELRSWKECFLQAYQVSRKDPEQNTIKIKPNEKSPSIQYNDMDCFTILDVQGSWLKIETAFQCENYSDYHGETVTGWIKWNDGQKILVNYILIGE